MDYEFIRNVLEGDGSQDEFPSSGAILCSVSPCVNSHEATISNGVVFEKLLGSENGFSENSLNNTYLMLDMKCISGVEKGKLASLGYKISDVTKWIGYM